MIIDKETITSDPLAVKQLQQAEKRYLAAYKKANYTHFSNTQLNQIFRFGAFDKLGDPVFFIFGVNQPYQNERMERLYLLMIRWFEQQFRNLTRNSGKALKFSIVYFNNQCNTYMQYIAFRGVYRSLPKRYFDNLKKIIVVNPGIAVRTLQWIVLGTINKYLRSLTYYIEGYNELEGHGVLLTKQSLNIIPQSMKTISQNKIGLIPSICNSVAHDTIVDSRRKQKIFLKRQQPASDKNIKYQNNQTKQKQKPFDLLKRTLQSYQLSDIQVPLVLKLLITYLQMRPDSLNQQGIFRRSVSIDDQQQAVLQIFNKNYDFLQKIQNPHIVANIIKKFLVNLIQPLIPYAIYNKFIYNIAENDIDLKYLTQIIKQLPKVRYITLQFVLGFFKDEVIPKHAVNKMTSYNISVVLCPCLFRSQNVSMNDLVYGKKLVAILEAMFLNFDFIFGTKKQQLQRYRESNHLIQQQFEKSLYIQTEQKKTQQKKVSEFPETINKFPQLIPKTSPSYLTTISTKPSNILESNNVKVTALLFQKNPKKQDESRQISIESQLFLSQQKSQKVQNAYDSFALSNSFNSMSSQNI